MTGPELSAELLAILRPLLTLVTWTPLGVTFAVALILAAAGRRGSRV